jgi:hypothetical protein
MVASWWQRHDLERTCGDVTAYGAIWYFFYEYQKLVLYDGISWGETPLAMSVEVLLSTVMQQTIEPLLDYLFTT